MNVYRQWHDIAPDLARILQTDVAWGTSEDYREFVARAGVEEQTFIPVATQDGETWGWIISGTLTARERQLLVLLTSQSLRRSADSDAQTEGPLLPQRALADYLCDVAHSGHLLPVPPDLVHVDIGERVPFYVVCHGSARQLNQKEVLRVLQSFFDGDVWVVNVAPNDRLVLPQVSLVLDDTIEDWKDSLYHWAAGLVELFAAELGEDVHCIVHHSAATVQALGQSLLQLKQSYVLGQSIYPRRNVFATWDLPLERLLHGLPSDLCRTFLHDLSYDAHNWWRDQEMRDTLETYFRLNLNVSETARQLYVHRNTLLYRLDKLKQETGLDVRNFEDAMLLRLAWLLTATEDAEPTE